MKDTASAIQASLPHAQKATAAGQEMLELVRALRDSDSRLSDAERAAARRRISELTQLMRTENKAAERPYEELSARHPEWVDY